MFKHRHETSTKGKLYRPSADSDTICWASEIRFPHSRAGPARICGKPHMWYLTCPYGPLHDTN